MKLVVRWCLLLMGIIPNALSQTAIPEFGTLTEEDKKITECSFDKEADAVILFDNAEAHPNDDRNLIMERHIRLKILKPKGIQRGNIEIPYYHKDNFEEITDIEALVYNLSPDGFVQMKSIDKSSIYRQSKNSLYSVVKFALPDVKPGSILEYKYTSTMKHYGGLDDWSFQSDIPTLLSCFDLVILPDSEFAYQIKKSEELPIIIKPNKQEGKIYFEMKNIAGLRDEPFMDAPVDYKQRVIFQQSGYQGSFGGRVKYMTTWDEVARELMSVDYLGGQLNKNLPGTSDLVNKVKSMSSPFEKLKTVYQFVQDNMTWNGITGMGAYEGIKTPWDKHKGSDAEINLILINLLKDAGLDVLPLLVSERGHGKVDPQYPFLGQFNTVMAYVQANGRYYVLDGTSYGTPAHLVPFSVVNTTAFLVNRKKGTLLTLTETERENKNLIFAQASLEKDGLVKGKATIYSYDYARLHRKRAYLHSKERYTADYLTSNNTELQIDSLQIGNLENDSLSLNQQFLFSVPATVSGDYRLLNLNLFTGFEKNPFVSDVRFTNVDFGCLQSLTLTTIITLPDNLQPEALPKGIRMIMPDTSIVLTRYLSFADHVITARFAIQVKNSVYTAYGYPYLKEFYKKMVGILNEPIVLRNPVTAKQ